MQINHNSPVPLYYQLREQIRGKIISKTWPDGYELPTEKSMCEAYKLSRATVKQALEGLVQEGLVVRKKGKGSFVTYPLIPMQFLSEPSFQLHHQKLGLQPGSRLVIAQLEPGADNICDKLGLEHGSMVCHIVRIRLIHGKPVLLENNDITPEYAGEILAQDLEETAIYSYLEECNGRSMDHYKLSVQPVLLDKYECTTLEMKPPAIGLVVETTSCIGETPVMVNTRLYRGDRYRLQLEYEIHNQKPELRSSNISDSVY